MKKAYLTFFALATLLVVSCSGEENKDDNKDKKTEEKKVDSTEVEKEVVYTEYVLDSATTLTWHGTHTVKEDKHHYGNVEVIKGSLKASLADAAIESGMFVIDLNTLTSGDLEGTMADNLIGHLKSPDFFNVSEFGTATLAVTGIEAGVIKGKLSVLGQDLDVVMPLQLIENAEGQLIANGSFDVDFAPTEMPGLQPEEGKEDKGHTNNVIKFDLNLVMNKK